VLDDYRVLASIGSVGDALDNAMAESFVDTFKTELIRDRVFTTHRQLELAIVSWVAWYNHQRLHEAIGDIPPAEIEALPRRQRECCLMSRTHETRTPRNPAWLTARFWTCWPRPAA
jgi:putative transposase